ncbi:MAG TPA: FAD-linked oxidase C-terminal domain-containing protein, partial [Pyrinomonadaceae bacterium]
MDTLVEQLRAATAVGRVLAEPHELLVYECDALTHYKARPRAVVFPDSTEEVAGVVRVLAREGVPFAPRGAGTGLSGGALALRGGVVIELARMRKILRLDAANRLAVVQTGVVNAHLTRAAAPHGLHYAPDPSSQATCTIGGNLAENAGGIHCLKYGTTVDHVAAARVVLSDGEVIDLGGAASADAPGYDLLGVFVGSEGTFGIATEVSVRLTPLPQAVRTVLADFRVIDDASRAVSAIIAEGLIPAALEMVDGATIRAVEASVFAAGLPTDAEAALLVELDGLEAGLDAETARVENICRRHGARTCRRARDEGERQKLWAARKGAFGAMGRITPDLMLQDAVVPRSRLPEVLADTYRIGAKYRLRVANVFHAGDGNLHPYICFDARNADEVARVKEAGREIMETCVRAGGTITGEHGTGLDKSDYLPLVFSSDTLRAMLEVRSAFDPLGLCNPGKVIPAPRGCGEARAVASRGAVRSKEGGGHDGDEARTAGEARDVGKGLSQVGASANANARAATHIEAHAATRADADASSTSTHVSSTHVTVATRARGARGRFEPAKALDALAEVVGPQNVSLRGESVVAAPCTTAEVREVLRLTGGTGWPVVPAGGETWTDAGNTLACAGRVVVNTTRLTGVIEHEPADLVATARAGTTLVHFNGALALARQWLPLDPPDDGRATLGGVAATGTGGAQS